MQAAVGKVLLVLFVLTFNHNSGNAREFERIKGRWTVVAAERGGAALKAVERPAEVEFVSDAHVAAQPPQSVSFTGSLETGRSRPVLRLTGKSTRMTDDNTTGAQPESEKSWAGYEIRGNRMRIIFTHTGPSDAATRHFTTTTEGKEYMLTLRRNK